MGKSGGTPSSAPHSPGRIGVRPSLFTMCGALRRGGSRPSSGAMGGDVAELVIDEADDEFFDLVMLESFDDLDGKAAGD